MRGVTSLHRRVVRKSSISAGAARKSIAACCLALETDKREGLPLLSYLRFSSTQCPPELDSTSHVCEPDNLPKAARPTVRTALRALPGLLPHPAGLTCRGKKKRHGVE